MTVEDAEKAIPAVVHMFAGCQDKQTSADVFNVSSFRLPDPSGKAGGALTSALLNVAYADHEDTGKTLSYKEVLYAVRDKLNGRFEQIPQLSSSRPFDVCELFKIVPDDFTGNRRAVMIGINYVGDNPGELRGCHYDALNMASYLKNCHGFTDDDFVLLLDDGKNIPPTHKNIMNAFHKLAADAQPGDALFVHFSGHGVRIPDDDGDEADGMDEALCPVDYKKAGMIRDDDILEFLVVPLPRGVTMTAVMDCCHSGSAMDLPFTYLADGEMEEMQENPSYDYKPLLNMVQTFAATGLEGLKKLHAAGKNRRKKRRTFVKNLLGL
jgi:hypothetical protein